MVVDDLDIQRSKLGPVKANPIPFVDADAVLPFTIAAQSLKAISWWNPEMVQFFHGVEMIQPPGGHAPKSPRARASRGLGVAAVEYVLRTLVRKRLDHRIIIACISCYSNEDASNVALQRRRKLQPGRLESTKALRRPLVHREVRRNRHPFRVVPMGQIRNSGNVIRQVVNLKRHGYLWTGWFPGLASPSSIFSASFSGLQNSASRSFAGVAGLQRSFLKSSEGCWGSFFSNAKHLSAWPWTGPGRAL